MHVGSSASDSLRDDAVDNLDDGGVLVDAGDIDVVDVRVVLGQLVRLHVDRCLLEDVELLVDQPVDVGAVAQQQADPAAPFGQRANRLVVARIDCDDPRPTVLVDAEGKHAVSPRQLFANEIERLSLRHFIAEISDLDVELRPERISDRLLREP